MKKKSLIAFAIIILGAFWLPFGSKKSVGAVAMQQLDPDCSISYATRPNSHQEWAADMTAVFDPPGGDYTATVYWEVQGAFTGGAMG
jgi:hypothetical protein